VGLLKSRTVAEMMAMCWWAQTTTRIDRVYKMAIYIYIHVMLERVEGYVMKHGR